MDEKSILHTTVIKLYYPVCPLSEYRETKFADFLPVRMNLKPFPGVMPELEVCTSPDKEEN